MLFIINQQHIIAQEINCQWENNNLFAENEFHLWVKARKGRNGLSLWYKKSKTGNIQANELQLNNLPM